MLAETTGPGLPRTMLHLAALLPLAGRGQWEEAEAHATNGAEAATNPFEHALAWMGRAVLAHARGQHDKVIDAVASLRATGDEGAVDEPGGPWPWQELQVEALIGTAGWTRPKRSWPLSSPGRSSRQPGGGRGCGPAARLPGSGQGI